MEYKPPVVWLTGMSGSGKSTLASSIKGFFSRKNYKIYVVDGDEVRDKDCDKLGFGYEDVMKNNIRIANLCNQLRLEYDAIIVPVISPYNNVRNCVRSLLEPNFHLAYLKVSIKTLRERDTKGLYLAADRGIIKDLIGYSEINPYDVPDNAEITINTGSKVSIEESKEQLVEYFSKLLL